MRQITFILTCLFSISLYGQSSLDKTKIYETVLQTLPDKSIPVINETFARIYEYDIDGDFVRWRYQRAKQSPKDSIMAISLICILPITYSQTAMDYLKSKNISADISSFLDQLKHSSADSLNKYIPVKKFISWEKAPLGRTAVGNLFKKKKVIALSNILFDSQNQIALVKVQTYSKNKLRSENPSKIIILSKAAENWVISGTLDEKQ